MELDQKFLYDTFNLYYNKGMEYKKNGNVDGAKRNLFLAAETLLKLAKYSEGELKNARLKRADRLVELAKSINAESIKKTIKQTQNPSNNKAKKSAGNPDAAGNGEEDTETKWIASEKTSMRFADVAGLDDVKESINLRIILPMKYPDIYEKYNKKAGGGVLLYGPPGTGKTMIAKAISTEVDACFYSVKCSDVVSKWFGEAEKNIKNLFETARQDKKAVIFFDEFEALAAKRGGQSSVMNRLVPELLAQIQGFSDANSTLLLLAATNRPWDIDSAMLRPGRFNELLYVPLPDAEARRFMINKSLKDVPLANDVNIDEIVTITEGFNGADVVEFCDRAKDDAIFRSINNSEKNRNTEEKITKEDIMKTAQKVKASVSKDDLKMFDEFLKNRC